MLAYWTAADYESLRRAKKFSDLADIALVILRRMNDTGREITQICGPMSTGGLGSREANMARFRLAIDRATHKGLFVFDQLIFQDQMQVICSMKNGSGLGGYNWGILEEFYGRVIESRSVRRFLFLNDWQNSIGTRWERILTTGLGLRVDEYPNEWLESQIKP